MDSAEQVADVKAWNSARVVVILGPTAVGKSDLAIRLAEAFQGEIVSADAMQIFRGLPIATNQPTPEELERVPHHLVAIRAPNEPDFDVSQFRTLALRAIEEITARGHLAIIVGGTNYYIEALLWSTLIDEVAVPSDCFREEVVVSSPDEERSVADLYKELEHLDPVMAARLIPTDSRKIRRSLEIIHQYKISHSELLDLQQGQRRCSRFSHCAIIFLDCETHELSARIERRVLIMAERGLRQELDRFIQKWGVPPDFEKGIYQAIGFKEFQPYFTIPDDDESRDKVFSSCLLTLERATRRYATRQLSWCKRRFFQSDAIANFGQMKRYALNASDMKNWDSWVLQPSMEITKSLVATHSSLPEPVLLSTAKHIFDLPQLDLKLGHEWQRFTCEACGHRRLNGEREWRLHRQSRSHRRNVKKQKQTLARKVDHKRIKTHGDGAHLPP